MDRASAGPEGRGCRVWPLDLPPELLRGILRLLENAYVANGQMSAEFLELRTVCKRFQQAVDSNITNLSWGIARSFCRRGPLLEVKDDLQRQLARWGSLRRVELHVRGSICALTQLIPALGQSCPGLLSLRIVKMDMGLATKTCHSISHLTSLTSLESLCLTGFNGFSTTLPPLPSLQTLTADFETLVCPFPFPALESFAYGDQDGVILACHLQAPHLHTSPLRRLSLKLASMEHLSLPRTLVVLDLVDVCISRPLDLGIDLPDLAEVGLVLEKYPGFSPVAPQGLAKLLSRGTLRQLKIHNLPGFPPLGQLAFQPGLTPLSQHSLQLQPPRLLEAGACLTNLELAKLTGVQRLDISHLRLQRLTLIALPELSLIEGLESQTQLASLALYMLPLITRLPDLRKFRDLVALKLVFLRLENWSPDCCSCLPRLKRLRLWTIMDDPPAATSAVATSAAATSAAATSVAATSAAVCPGGSPQQASAPMPTFKLDFGSLASLTELDLGALLIPRADVRHLLLLEKLRIHECCPDLSHLLGLHSLPRLHSLILEGFMPKLQSLSVASCPRLTTFSCRLDNLQHLSMEDLPGLSSGFDCSFTGLRTLCVASCPALTDMPLHQLYSIESLTLAGLPQLQRPELVLCDQRMLTIVRLIDLAKCSRFILVNCRRVESVQVSGCPLTALRLGNLPQLTAPNLHIDNLSLHTPDRNNLPVITSAPPLPPAISEHEAPSVPRQPPNSHQNLLALTSLDLIQLPGLWSLDQVSLQTELRSLKLEGLRLSRLPKTLSSLTALSELLLKDLEVECSDPLPPSTLRSLRHLTLSGGTDLVHWSAPVGSAASPLPHIWAEGATFTSVTILDLSELNLARLDVSQLASIQELTVHDCAVLTRLAGVTNLPDLTSLRLTSVPELKEVAILSCPKFKSLKCSALSPGHLHLEDLPSLELQDFSCDGDRWLGFSEERRPVNPLAFLQSLKLRRLPNISKLLLRALEKLEFVEVVHCSSLQEVHLESLASLTSLRLEEPMREFPSDASSSIVIPQGSFSCIKSLSIHDMAKLQSIQCPPTLRSLSVCSCLALTSLPLDNVPHLANLTLRDVAKEVVPAWFRQLRSLQHMEYGRSAKLE